MQQLTSLDLSHNRLSALDPEVGHCLGLTSLNLSGNSSEVFASQLMDRLPAHLGILGLHNLTDLDLSGVQACWCAGVKAVCESVRPAGCKLCV